MLKVELEALLDKCNKANDSLKRAVKIKAKELRDFQADSAPYLLEAEALKSEKETGLARELYMQRHG